MGFKLKAPDGTYITVPDGEYYFNTKARGRRMMLNSLSSDARRVYACLELATMGFQQELAVTMAAGKQRPLTPTDITQQTGLSKQNARRGLVELEDAGLAQRVSDDKGPLRNGHIQIYSWAVPREPKVKKVVERDYLFPEWFPESWAPLKPFISRFKYSFTADEVVARDYFEEGAVVARRYQEGEMGAARFLEKVCARPQKARASLYGKNGKNNTERISSSAVTNTVVSRDPRENRNTGAAKAEEDGDSFYQKFKAAYPASHFDEPKAKPLFEGKTLTQQATILERLEVYLPCDRWKDEDGRWIPLASTWLKSYDADPPPALKKNAASGKKGFTESVMEEAKRRFDKYGRV